MLAGRRARQRQTHCAPVLGPQAVAGLVNMDVDRVVRMVMERVRSVEAEMPSLPGNEKCKGEMECRNEG